MAAPTRVFRQSGGGYGIRPQTVEKPPSAREVPRRGGGREPCHSPKYFGQPYSSLPHRLRAEPPRRGGQGLNAPFLTVWGRYGIRPRPSKNLPLRDRLPRYGGGGACARGGAVPRRGGGREPCHSPKYFGQPYSSLPHRLRAEPPRRGGQGLNAPFLTV